MILQIHVNMKKKKMFNHHKKCVMVVVYIQRYYKIKHINIFINNYNVSVINQPDNYRNLIINLEPCKGIVYLFVRKTRRCWPNPYSCIDLSKGLDG